MTARVRAPEFPADKVWLNTQKPFSIKGLRGNFVLLDFWTYCCINCLHILPDLKYLEHKYAASLTVIGVHTSKSDHEKEVESIRQAILRYDIEHPVVIDNNMRIWSEYDVRAWPTLILIDPQGYCLGKLTGEGHRHTLDQQLKTLIAEYKSQGKVNPQSLILTLEKQQNPQDTPLAFPGKVLADRESQSLFIADSGHHRLVVSDFEGNVQTILGQGQSGWKDGAFTEAEFNAPQGMAFDPVQNLLYVADTENHVIRQVDFQQQQVTTIAGIGSQSHQITPHAGLALEIALNSPWDLVQIEDKLYITMAGAHQVWSLDLVNSRIETYAGTGREACFNGLLKGSAFAQPSGITTDGKRLFVADSEVSSIRGIELTDKVVQTICGSGDLFGWGDRDGEGFDVLLQHCLGVEYHQGWLWVADTYNHKVKRINLKTDYCETVAGGNQAGQLDGQGTQSLFFEPSGVSAAINSLYIADTNNHQIRRLDLETFVVTTLEFPQLCAPHLCLP
jgi:DNA-binding beta-propeller fold protein YncE